MIHPGYDTWHHGGVRNTLLLRKERVLNVPDSSAIEASEILLDGVGFCSLYTAEDKGRLSIGVKNGVYTAKLAVFSPTLRVEQEGLGRLSGGHFVAIVQMWTGRMYLLGWPNPLVILNMMMDHGGERKHWPGVSFEMRSDNFTYPIEVVNPEVVVPPTGGGVGGSGTTPQPQMRTAEGDVYISVAKDNDYEKRITALERAVTGQYIS